MAIANVALGDIIDENWGNAVADAINALTPTFITTGATPVAGWDVTTFHAVRSGWTVTFDLVITRTGADLNIGTDAEPEVHVATLPAFARGNNNLSTPVGNGSEGREMTGYYLATDGRLFANTASGGVTAGRTFSLGGTVIVNKSA